MSDQFQCCPHCRGEHRRDGHQDPCGIPMCIGNNRVKDTR